MTAASTPRIAVRCVTNLGRAGDSMIPLTSIDGELCGTDSAMTVAEGCNMDSLSLRVGPFDETAICPQSKAPGVAIGTRVPPISAPEAPAHRSRSNTATAA